MGEDAAVVALEVPREGVMARLAGHLVREHIVDDAAHLLGASVTHFDDGLDVQARSRGKLVANMLGDVQAELVDGRPSKWFLTPAKMPRFACSESVKS